MADLLRPARRRRPDHHRGDRDQPQGLGWPYAPGLWNDEQVEGWKPVTEAVHEAGGRIFAQLWHMGRLVHPTSAAASRSRRRRRPRRDKAHTYEGKPALCRSARAATRDDIARIVGDYARAARNAIAAGFDGVQIHAANGYLIDQFLRDGANLRDDDYGGPIENRLRLLREVLRRSATTVGIERTAVRFSPNGASQGVNDRDPLALFPARGRSGSRSSASPCLELREPGPDGTFGKADRPSRSARLSARPSSGRWCSTATMTARRAQARSTRAWPTRSPSAAPSSPIPTWSSGSRVGAPLNPATTATWYSQGPEGYVDYPALDESAKPPEAQRTCSAQRRAWRARRCAAASPPLSLRRVGADERLGLVLDGEDAVADGEAVEGQRHQAAGAFAGDDLEMIGLAADHHARARRRRQ